MNSLIKIIATVGGIGTLKPAPGTLASALAAGTAFCLKRPDWIFFIFLWTLGAGLLISQKASNLLGSRDPSAFVLDEWCGMMLSVLFVPPTPGLYILAFFAFRFFDVMKPLGIRRLDAWNHPFSIMLDDVLAGLYTNLVLQVVSRMHFAGI